MKAGATPQMRPRRPLVPTHVTKIEASAKAPRWAAAGAAIAHCVLSCATPASQTGKPGARDPHPLSASSLAPKSAPWSDADAPVPVTSNDPMWGRRDAPVTLVEFGDFECPSCAGVHPTIEALRKLYGPDKLRVIWKNFPLPQHAHARSAAEAAQGAFSLGGNDAFWAFQDAAFRDPDGPTPHAYETWIGQTKVALAEWRNGQLTHRWMEKVDEDVALASKLGVSATPTFFMNALPFVGAPKLESLRALVDRELERATAAIGAGVPRERLYAALSSLNAQEMQEQALLEDDRIVWRVPLGKSPVRGPAWAPVTIIEFSDFQCPFCKRVEDTLVTLRASYGDRIRIAWKDEPLPFHDRARPAAALAREARAQKGNAGFWTAHDRLLASTLTDEDLVRIGTELGIKKERVRQAIVDPAHFRAIDEDTELAAAFRADGTPHFFINGRRLSGAQPEAAFRAIIDEEIDRAGKMLESGIKKEDLYDALIRDGRGPQPSPAQSPDPAHPKETP